jgi:hypothetical protein
MSSSKIKRGDLVRINPIANNSTNVQTNSIIDNLKNLNWNVFEIVKPEIVGTLTLAGGYILISNEDYKKLLNNTNNNISDNAPFENIEGIYNSLIVTTDKYTITKLQTKSNVSVSTVPKVSNGGKSVKKSLNK